jgi:hypothetical protein
MRPVRAGTQIGRTLTTTFVDWKECQFDINFKRRQWVARLEGLELTDMEVREPKRHPVRLDALDRKRVLRVHVDHSPDVSDSRGPRYSRCTGKQTLLIHGPSDPNESMIRERHLLSQPTTRWYSRAHRSIGTGVGKSLEEDPCGYRFSLGPYGASN